MAQPVASAPSANAQSLLNLLNFGPSTSTLANANSGRPSSASNGHVSSEGQNGKVPSTQAPRQEPLASASDLVAKLMSPPAEVRPALRSPFNLEDQGGGGDRPSSTNARDASQDALLKLLSKAQLGNSVGARQAPIERTQSGQPRDATDIQSLFTSIKTPQSAPAETPAPASKPPVKSQPMFTYTNPFEALRTPLNASPAPTPGDAASVPTLLGSDIPHPSVESGLDQPEVAPSRVATTGQVGKRKILTPRLPSVSKNTTISREASADPSPPNWEAGSDDVAPAQEIVAVAPPEGRQEIQTMEETPEDGRSEAKHGDISEVEKAVARSPDGGDEWEDMEGSPNKEDTRVVPVYNFPIKPFVSLSLQLPRPSEVGIRDDGVMEISRLKKEFDQLDRSLAAATSKYITYALVKNGGMRIIRQDDGSDRQVFKNSGDRIFTVSLCTSSAPGEPSDDQAVLGTGVSGTVYYATINKNGNDLFEKNELETESLIFPPYPPADENTAGGVLKTRAKRSSRHPEFFAIGRGKAIHLVWPATALSPRYGVEGHNRRVDVEKFFQERSLQIATGKAGKDFTFSEDDTLVVSLDKTGRLRFWDIRKLIDESNASAARVAGVIVDSPLLSLSTASPSEKSWPTSVMFVDKVRPYNKGSALRYVLVGLRQNHTLQLWDVALGKAVQELNFPHENETDPICSVCYHANSGIIVVGHPTRNSLFFIHLSAPRYTLATSLSQAAYVQRIAQKDPELPKPESTACMSGIREISFAEKGQLRSVEILPVHRTTDAQKNLDERKPLFELYIVHSKGVTCLNIAKEDLGWDANSKVVHAINAADDGYVTLKELRLGSVIEEGHRESSPAEEMPQPSKSSKKKSGKKSSTSTERAETTQVEEAAPSKPTPVHTQGNAPEPAKVETSLPKETKKSKKKATQVADSQVPEKVSPATESPVKAAPSSKSASLGADQAPIEGTASAAAAAPSTTEGLAKQEAVTVGVSGDWLDKELKKVEKAVSTEFRKELGALHQNIQNDRVVQDSAAIARQEALLRLVSTTLSNNVDKAMSRILSAEMDQSIIPALTTATVQAVTGQVGDAVTKSLHSVVPHELRAQLPAAINVALQSPNMTRAIADTISPKIAKHLETQLSDILERQVVPAFKTLALSAAEKAASQVEVRLRNEIRQLENDRRHDLNRLEKLGEVLQATAATLQQMSDTQVAFQGQILKDRRQLALFEEGSSMPGSRQVSTARMTPSPRAISRPSVPRQKTQGEIELEEISQLMSDGRYEEASIKWLQSTQPADLFDKLFIHFTPEYLSTDVSPLIAFSIAVTIGNSLTTNTAQRLEWISAAFNSVDLSVSPSSLYVVTAADTCLQDPEIADLAQHAPALLSSLIQKLERLYMTIAERDPADPALQIMPAVSRRAKEMRSSLGARG
jgi:WD40 repeat protein